MIAQINVTQAQMLTPQPEKLNESQMWATLLTTAFIEEKEKKNWSQPAFLYDSVLKTCHLKQKGYVWEKVQSKANKFPVQFIVGFTFWMLGGGGEPSAIWPYRRPDGSIQVQIMGYNLVTFSAQLTSLNPSTMCYTITIKILLDFKY